MNVVEVCKKQIVMYVVEAHCQLGMPPKHFFKHVMKTAYFLILKRKNRQMFLGTGVLKVYYNDDSRAF